MPSGLKAENRLVTTPSFIQSCLPRKTSYISAKNSDFITSNLYGLSIVIACIKSSNKALSNLNAGKTSEKIAPSYFS